MNEIRGINQKMMLEQLKELLDYGIIDKQGVSFIVSVDQEGFPNAKACIYFCDRRFFRGVMLKGSMEVLEDQ